MGILHYGGYRCVIALQDALLSNSSLARKPLSELCELSSMHFSVRMANLPLIVDADLHQLGCPVHLALLLQQQTERPAVYSCPAAITELAGNRHPLLVVVKCPMGFPQHRVGSSQVAQDMPLGLPVTVLLRNRQALLVVRNCLVDLAQLSIGYSHVSQDQTLT